VKNPGLRPGLLKSRAFGTETALANIERNAQQNVERRINKPKPQFNLRASQAQFY
jgi:hypothetical protein